LLYCLAIPQQNRVFYNSDGRSVFGKANRSGSGSDSLWARGDVAARSSILKYAYTHSTPFILDKADAIARLPSVVRFVWHSPLSTNGDNRGDWPGHRRHVGKARLQCRLNRLFFTPEIISVKDNLVSGTGVAEPPLAAAGVPANGGWLGTSLGPCRLMTFRFF